MFVVFGSKGHSNFLGVANALLSWLLIGIVMALEVVVYGKP